jgi:signal transduction histidine kinase
LPPGRRVHRGKSKGSSDYLMPSMGKKLVAVWVSLTVAVVVVVYLFSYQEKLRLDLDRVAHIREVLALVYDLENHLADAESAARGYLLTREERQLERYHEEVQEIGPTFDELYQLTAEEPKPRRLLDGLKPLINQRQVLFLKLIDLTRQTGLEGPEPRAVAREGSKLQDRIRKSLEKLEDLEKKQLNPEWAAERKKTRIILWGLTGGALTGLTLLSLVLYVLNREINERKRAEGQVAAYQENLRSLVSQLSLAEERERRRLAANLHDRIGHTLALANIKLGELQKSAATIDPNSLGPEIDKITKLMRQAIQETQSLTFKISPPILYELGLEAALEWLTEQLQEEYGIATSFASDHEPAPLDDDVRILLFQAVSELLVNAVKHARARNLKVSIKRAGADLKVEVADDGVGFQVPETGVPRQAQGGFGLFSIRERLRPGGGLLEVHSTPGAGARVTLTVPLKAKPAAEKPHEH